VIRLYDKPECPFCYRVRVALNYSGVAYQRLQYDEADIEREWKSLTHAKTVPVMVDGDLVLTDSTLMLEYLQDLHGGLLPDEPQARARARSLLQYADNPLGRGSREVVFAKRGVAEADWDQARIAAGAEQFLNSLPKLETLLDGRDFFVESFSVADCALSTRFALSAAYGLEIPARFLNLNRWFEARLQEDFLPDASPLVVSRWLDQRSVREAS